MRNPLKGKDSQEPGLVRDWEARFGRPRPKVAALIGLATGGSHFVLHKLHGHPQVMALKQRALYPELKHYFGEGSLPMQSLLERQLRPRKESLKGLAWLIVNKPQMAFISNQYLFNRDQIAAIYSLRNPMALYHSRAKDRTAFGQKVYGRELDWREIAESIAAEYRVSIASFAQVYDPQRDSAVNLESFVAQLDENLSAMWALLDLSPVATDALATLESCERCGRPLMRKVGHVGVREEELLYCAHDDLFYTGPGGYNYIREVALERLAGWKEKAHAEELSRFFEGVLGRELVQYFEDDKYLELGSANAFKAVFEDLLARFRPS